MNMRRVTNLLLLVALTVVAGVTDTRRPNVLVIQPDDLPHYDAWNRPPNSRFYPDFEVPFPGYGLPNLERLRNGGVELTQAYTTSAMCGTSRWSTITGRYPSRARSNAGKRYNSVIIPRTKLEDADCKSDNIAVQFRDNGGYRTSMFGKWHLSSVDYANYTYDYAKSLVNECGFEHVSGLYPENLGHEFNDGSFSHNMEWVTAEAVEEIRRGSEDSDPWFMYFNPTVPHSGDSVARALSEFSCRDTPSGRLETEPVVPGLTDNNRTCAEYRETIWERAMNEPTDDDLGAIWLDDAIGSLLQVLEETGQLEDTIILFFEDHGMEPKASLYEGGVRVPMFISYGTNITSGSTLDVPVSTIDIGPTLLDFAGILPTYPMDGRSLGPALTSATTNVDLSSLRGRCIFFELGTDRAVRCGCHKYLEVNSFKKTWMAGNDYGLANDPENLFNLCVYDTSRYSPDIFSEANSISNEQKSYQLRKMMECHLDQVESQDFGTEYDCQLNELPNSASQPRPAAWLIASLLVSKRSLQG